MYTQMYNQSVLRWKTLSFWRTACVVGALILSTLPYSSKAQASNVKRCLRHSDCPTGYSCTSRRCFKGLQVVVGGRKTAAYQIAIPKVRWFGAPSVHSKRMQRAIWLQVNRNFKLLPGTFNLIDKRSFLERPPYNGVDLGTFYFKPWIQIKTNGLLKIGLRKLGKDTFTLLFRFYDVDESKLVVRSNPTIRLKDYRWFIHRLCDRVYRYLTNQPGVFSTKIAYVKRNRTKGKDIWISDFDGHNRRRIVSNGSINVMPRWSPDGRHLIFTSYLTGGANLYKINLKTRKMTRLRQRKGTYTGASFHPKTGQIAFAMTAQGSNAAADIYVSQSSGARRRRLTKSWGIDVSPSWSPDGKQLAFVSERYASPQIFLMNADGSGQTRLTFKGDYNQEPRWSPRGNEIMFTARDEFLKYDLFVIRLNKDASGALKPTYRRLTQNQGTNLEATWSPDGRYILFVSTRVGERKLFIMNTDGSKQQLFLRGWGNFETPAWSPILKTRILPSGGKGRSFYRTVRLLGVRKNKLGRYIVAQSSKQSTPAVRSKPAQKPSARTQDSTTKGTASKPVSKKKTAQIKQKAQPKARTVQPKARPTQQRSQPSKRREG